jgi:hypothetical protein
LVTPYIAVFLYLTEAVESHPEYSHFAQRVMALAGEFRLPEIKKLLQLASKEAHGNDR